jgi:hypothetical protein
MSGAITVIHTYRMGLFWAVTDGTDTLELCPCCGRRFETQRVAQLVTDKFNGGLWNWQDAVEHQKLWTRNA